MLGHRLVRYGAWALVAVFGTAFLLSPVPVQADTVSGEGTNGCVTEATLYTGSAVGVWSLSISFHVVMTGSPTVMYGSWWAGSSGFSGYWWTNSGAASEYYVVGTTGTNTTVNVNNGSSGTVSYRVRVPGYGSGSCVTIDQVRVVRTFRSIDGATPPPGGVGFSAPPSATPPPTQPAGAPSPTASSATTWCVINAAGSNVCYPAPPSGWCYTDTFLAFGSGTAYEPCGAVPSWAPPTPSPTPPATSCAGLGEHMWCGEWAGTVGGSYERAPDTIVLGSGVTELNFLAGKQYNIGGWGTLSYGGGWTSGTRAHQWRSWLSGCSSPGLGGALPWRSDMWHTSGQTKLMDGTTGSPGSTAYTVWTAPSSGSCVGNGSGVVRMSVPASTYAGVLWIDPVDTAEWSPGPTPTPTPTPTAPAVTQPPDYWGGGTQPPINVDVDISHVDVCRKDPTIAACAKFSPVPTIDPSGALAAFGDLYNDLMSKAPFGYVGQAADLLNAAASAAANSYTNGQECFGCFELPVWRPAEAGGPYTVTADLPLDDFTASLGWLRSILAALLYLAVAVALIRWAIRATGTSASSGGGAGD